MRTFESWTQFYHFDLLVKFRPVLDIRYKKPRPVDVLSTGLTFDEQCYTELLPDTADDYFWPITTTTKSVSFTLPSAEHGIPNAYPFRRLRVGGVPGTVNAWSADRTAHRGLCPAGRLVPGKPQAALTRVLDMSVVLYSAVTARDRHIIDLNNAVVDSAHTTLDQVGLVCRLWCHACGEGIRFQGTYDSLGPVWACRLCIAANAKTGVLAHHKLQGLGEVMCGRCHKARSDCGMRAPLTQHKLHLGCLADLRKDFVLLSAEDAKTHAVLDVRDLAHAFGILGAVFGSAAWSRREDKIELSRLSWNGVGDQPRRRVQPVTGDHTTPDHTLFAEHKFYLDVLKVRCTGMQSVVFSLLRSLKAQRLLPADGVLPTKSQGGLLHRYGDREICVNHQLAEILDRAMTMEDACKVAKAATYNWKDTVASSIVRCTCAYAPGGSRKEHRPGVWDGFADVRPVPPCQDVPGSRQDI